MCIISTQNIYIVDSDHFFTEKGEVDLDMSRAQCVF